MWRPERQCFNAHAEARTISRCGRPGTKMGNLLIRATIIVVRISNGGVLRMSRPCAKCMERIKTSGIKKIVYSTDNGYVTEKVA